MPLKLFKGIRKTVGFRLTLWYSAILLFSFSALFIFAYLSLSASLKRYEREAIRLELKELGTAYQSGGIDALKKEIEFEKRATGKNPFFMRLVSRENSVLFLNLPDPWTREDLKELEANGLSLKEKWYLFRRRDDVFEMTSLRLPDGQFLQVGKSIARRGNLLKRFHFNAVGLIILMILVTFAGGIFLAFRALRPIRGLIETLQSITKTGRVDIRVPTRQSNDEIEELSIMFNGMLGKIEVLINGMKGSLDNVAHDLRTPLTRLRGMAERALRSEQSTEGMRDSLIACVEESERVLTMLDTLMDISEAETGTMKLDLTEVNILDLIGETIGIYEHVAEEKGITLHSTCQENFFLKVDPRRVRQVLANLLDNAIKYTPAGGRVDIETGRQLQEAAVSIKDTGIGIPADELPRIWERLYRVDKSRTQRGLGLGLSLVKAVVQAHGGRVDVSSRPGVGSIFWIYLPKKS